MEKKKKIERDPEGGRADRKMYTNIHIITPITITATPSTIISTIPSTTVPGQPAILHREGTLRHQTSLHAHLLVWLPVSTFAYVHIRSLVGRCRPF